MYTQSQQVQVSGSFGAKLQIRWFSDGHSLVAPPEMIGRGHFSQPPFVETRFNNHFESTPPLSIILLTSSLYSSLQHFALDYAFVRAKHATPFMSFSPSNSFLIQRSPHCSLPFDRIVL